MIIGENLLVDVNYNNIIPPVCHSNVFVIGNKSNNHHYVDSIEIELPITSTF